MRHEQETGSDFGRQTSTPVQGPIAFLYPAFPVLHQTFVMWEAVSLRRLGLDLRLYSLKRPPAGPQQPEAHALMTEVVYLPSVFSPKVVAANLRFLFRHPGRLGAALVRLMREWWHDRRYVLDRRSRVRALETKLSWKVWFEGMWNTSPAVYLLKSLLLVPMAVVLGERLERDGIARVHAHWATHATTVALLLRWFYGTRFSFTAHAYDIYLMPVLLPVKLREADFVVTCAGVNAAYLRSLASAPEAKIHVNYHGVDLRRFAPRERRERWQRPRIVTCGSLRVYKGHHVVLAACARLRHEVDCVIIGDGPQRGVLETQARDLGLDTRVQFTGALVQEEVARHYAEADLFVLASIVVEDSGRQDVIPNVLVEAMAMGIPVVASALPGIQELIVDGVHGRLVPPGDVELLARAIDELLDDPERRRRLGEQARQRVVADFDRERNVDELARILRSAP